MALGFKHSRRSSSYPLFSQDPPVSVRTLFYRAGQHGHLWSYEARGDWSSHSWRNYMTLFPQPTAVSASLRFCVLAFNLAADGKNKRESMASFSFLLVLSVVQHFMLYL